MPEPSSSQFSCPVCGSQTRVGETRQLEDGRLIRRRRTCTNGHRFTSLEFADAVHLVRKRAGWLERFDEDKLRRSIVKAAAGTIHIDIDKIVADVVDAAADAPKQIGDALSTIEIGLRVLRGLKEQDSSEIAPLRFGSVFYRHHAFSSREDLIRAIDQTDQPVLFVLKRTPEPEFLEATPDRRQRQPFDHLKLRRSIDHAVRKTVAAGEVASITDYVAEAVALEAVPIWEDGVCVRREVEAETIGKVVLGRLKKIDWVPYARYLSVFDPDRFRTEIEMPTGGKAGTPDPISAKPRASRNRK